METAKYLFYIKCYSFENSQDVRSFPKAGTVKKKCPSLFFLLLKNISIIHKNKLSISFKLIYLSAARLLKRNGKITGGGVWTNCALRKKTIVHCR